MSSSSTLVIVSRASVVGFSESIWSSVLHWGIKTSLSSFGILKERFRCLKSPLSFRTIEMNCKVTCACVLLHNFLIDQKDAHNPVLIDDVSKNLTCSSGVSDGLQDPSSTKTGYEKSEELLWKLTRWTRS